MHRTKTEDRISKPKTITECTFWHKKYKLKGACLKENRKDIKLNVQVSLRN